MKIETQPFGEQSMRPLFHAKTRGGKFEITAVEDVEGAILIVENVHGKSQATSVGHTRDSAQKDLRRRLRDAEEVDGIRYVIDVDELGVLEPSSLNGPDLNEEKVWVEAEQTPGGNVVLSLADVRQRRVLVQKYGRHNVYTEVSNLKNFPEKYIKELSRGWPVRFKMFPSAFEMLISSGLGGFEGWDEDLDEYDAFIRDAPPLGSRTSASIGGKHVGVFKSEAAAVAALKEEAKTMGFMPNLWYVDDHGGVNLRHWEDF